MTQVGRVGGAGLRPVVWPVCRLDYLKSSGQVPMKWNVIDVGISIFINIVFFPLLFWTHHFFFIDLRNLNVDIFDSIRIVDWIEWESGF